MEGRETIGCCNGDVSDLHCKKPHCGYCVENGGMHGIRKVIGTIAVV